MLSILVLIKGVAEDEMVKIRGSMYVSEQTQGNSEGHGSLACCSPWGRKELDTTEQLNSNK